MVSAVIGSNGFIGSRLKWYSDNYLEEEWVGINRENYDRWRNYKFKKIIWAGGSARKDLTQGELEKLNFHAVTRALLEFKHEKFIYISSQAVYPSEALGVETDVIDHDLLSGYGKSKFYGEVTVKNYASDPLWIRPNGFCGPGLKKNVIHSLSKTPPELYYTWDSRLQVMHTDVFAFVVFMLASSYNGVFNVTSPEVVTPVDIAGYMGVDLKDVIQPKGRILPNVHAVLDTSKLDSVLREEGILLPTTEEAVRKWNEPFEIPMPRVWSELGKSRGWR